MNYNMDLVPHILDELDKPIGEKAQEHITNRGYDRAILKWHLDALDADGVILLRKKPSTFAAALAEADLTVTVRITWRYSARPIASTKERTALYASRNAWTGSRRHFRADPRQPPYPPFCLLRAIQPREEAPLVGRRANRTPGPQVPSSMQEVHA